MSDTTTEVAAESAPVNAPAPVNTQAQAEDVPAEHGPDESGLDDLEFVGTDVIAYERTLLVLADIAEDARQPTDIRLRAAELILDNVDVI